MTPYEKRLYFCRSISEDIESNMPYYTLKTQFKKLLVEYEKLVRENNTQFNEAYCIGAASLTPELEKYKKRLSELETELLKTQLENEKLKTKKSFWSRLFGI